LLAAALAASLGGATFLAGRPGPTPDVTTTLPADRGLIAIASSGVTLVDPVTGGRIRGLQTPMGTWSATWSPDGRRLAFVLRDGIWTMDLETGEQELVAAVECRGVRWWDCELAWSPGGGMLAVTEGSQLLLVDVASGAVVVRIDQRGTKIRSPAWSPDGAALAFFVDSTLSTAPAASGPATVVVEESDAVWLPRDIAWSPDGRTLAWMAFPDAAPTDRKHIVIAASNADGSNQRVLFDAGSCVCISGNWGPPGFGWSPDGTQMAFVTQGRGQFEPASGGLFVVEADGTIPRLLAPSDGGRPLWQPVP
jgi:Tol biopolymer transport system component